jgi:hypothetical protein
MLEEIQDEVTKENPDYSKSEYNCPYCGKPLYTNWLDEMCDATIYHCVAEQIEFTYWWMSGNLTYNTCYKDTEGNIVHIDDEFTWDENKQKWVNIIE